MRVNDILSELERQVGPLERQAQKARVYLKKKEELKTYDVNMFLMEVDRIENQLREVQDKFQIADAELKDANASYESVRSDYEKMEQSMAAMDEQMSRSGKN